MVALSGWETSGERALLVWVQAAGKEHRALNYLKFTHVWTSTKAESWNLKLRRKEGRISWELPGLG